MKSTPCPCSRSHILKLFAVAVCLPLVACNKNDDPDPLAKGDTVDLRALPPLGFKWTGCATQATKFKSGPPGGCTGKRTTKNEVLAVTDDTVTVKSTAETTDRYWGSAYKNPDAENSKTRLTITTVDRCNRVLSSEGSSQDEFSESPWPNRPLKIGESFTTKYEGHGVNAYYNGVTTYTLSEVATLDKRRVAVLHFTFSGSLEGAGIRWIDLQTGRCIKSSHTVVSQNSEGHPMETSVEYEITDTLAN